MNYSHALFMLFLFNPFMPLLGSEASDSRIGKTHFVVGSPPQSCTPAACLAEKPASVIVKAVEKKESTCVLFSPDDNVRDALIKIIDDEKEAIATAVFMITDKAIA